jgi:hypothetical protein
MMHTYTSPWGIGDKAVIDGDDSIVVHVIGVRWQDNDGHVVAVAWMHNGGSQSAWIENWRLTKPKG